MGEEYLKGQMTAAVLYGKEDIKIERVPIPTLERGEVLIKVNVALTCGTDLTVFQRGYHARMIVPPALFGHELSGVIAEVGPGVRDFRRGMKVVALNSAPCGSCFYCVKHQENLCEDLLFNNGAYAEYIAVSTHMLVSKPKELSWEECAGIPEVWITALQALYYIGGFAPGKSVLWHAGASGVSIAGIQLSIDGGAPAVYATARSDEKCEFCVKELGCKAAYNTTKGDGWANELIEASAKKGIDHESQTNFRWCGDALRISSLYKQISRRTDGSSGDPTVGCDRSSASAQGLFRRILTKRPNRDFPTANSRVPSIGRSEWHSGNLQSGRSDLDG